MIVKSSIVFWSNNMFLSLNRKLLKYTCSFINYKLLCYVANTYIKKEVVSYCYSAAK